METELGRLRAENKRLKDECEEWRAEVERLYGALEAALVPLATFILSGEIDKNEWLGPEPSSSRFATAKSRPAPRWGIHEDYQL